MTEEKLYRACVCGKDDKGLLRALTEKKNIETEYLQQLSVHEWEQIEDADLIFLIQCRKNTIQTVLSRKARNGKIILIGDTGELEEYVKAFGSQITDIWEIMSLTPSYAEYKLKSLLLKIRQEEDAAYRNKSLLAAIQSASDLMWVTGQDGQVTLMNEKACHMAGMPEKDIRENREKSELFVITGAYEQEAAQKKRVIKADVSPVIAGRKRYFHISCQPIMDDHGSIRGVLTAVSDRTKENMYKKELEEKANTDFLTGFYNRWYMENYEKTITGKPVCIYAISILGFKELNDCLGSTAGDEVILMFSQILKRAFRKKAVFKTGGVSFLVFDEGVCTEAEIAEKRTWLSQMLTRSIPENDRFKLSYYINSCYMESASEMEIKEVVRTIEYRTGQIT